MHLFHILLYLTDRCMKLYPVHPGFESLLTLVSLDIDLWFVKLKGVEVAFWLPLANVLNLLWRQVLLFVDSSLLVIKKQVRFNNFLFPSVCWNQEFNSLLRWQLKIFNLFLRVATWRSAERVGYCVYKQVVCEGGKKTWKKITSLWLLIDHSFFGNEWQKRWCALSSNIFYYYGSEKGGKATIMIRCVITSVGGSYF